MCFFIAENNSLSLFHTRRSDCGMHCCRQLEFFLLQRTAPDAAGLTWVLLSNFGVCQLRKVISIPSYY